jgi:hypothetical protein
MTEYGYLVAAAPFTQQRSSFPAPGMLESTITF